MFNKLTKFSGVNLIVFIVCECVGIPLCLAGGDAAAHLDYVTAVIGWGFGIPLAAMGFTFPFWSGPAKASTLAWAQKNGGIAVPVAILLAFGYAVGPQTYRKAVSTFNGAPQPNGPIAWNIEQAAQGSAYFLNMMKTFGKELRILGFQAHGRNISTDPISHLSGYIRSDLTNAQIPIYLQAQDADQTKIHACFPHPWIPTAPDETYGIPGFAEFDIGTYEKPFVEISLTEGVKEGVTAADFLATFVPFTVVLEYDGGNIKRKFSRTEVEQQFTIFEAGLNPLSNPHVLRKTDARPPTLAPLHPLIPLATPVPSNNTPTGTIPPKD
jgi:hypothetical protein